MQIVLSFAIEYATKRTVRFTEITTGNQAAKVGSLYVQKAAFDGADKPPKRLRVTIEPEVETGGS